ncbi:MAG: SoxR reducing system RseC family protein [Firmicutes bacterium]|nr:SoxR reducing system RseC family protein [Bacillota bacterium]
MNQVGFVKALENNKALVEVRRVSACGSNCASCGGECNIPSVTVRIENKLNAKPGEFVEIKMGTKTILKSAFIAYIIPLILMVLGIVLGIKTFKSMNFESYETFGFLVGILFLGGSHFILKSIDKKIVNKNKLEFEMVRKIGK